jgi:hypothetical protein
VPRLVLPQEAAQPFGRDLVGEVHREGYGYWFMAFRPKVDVVIGRIRANAQHPINLQEAAS